MQQLQPRRAFTSLEASHTIHQQVLELPSLRNTRTIIGGMFDRSTNQYNHGAITSGALTIVIEGSAGQG